MQNNGPKFKVFDRVCRVRWLALIFLLPFFALAADSLRSHGNTTAPPPDPCPSGAASCYQAGYIGLSPLEQQGRDIDIVTPQFFRKDNFFTRILCYITGTGALNQVFLDHDNAPDFVQDHGHTFGSDLSDAEKQALIEYMKTF